MSLGRPWLLGLTLRSVLDELDTRLHRGPKGPHLVWTFLMDFGVHDLCVEERRELFVPPDGHPNGVTDPEDDGLGGPDGDLEHDQCRLVHDWGGDGRRPAPAVAWQRWHEAPQLGHETPQRGDDNRDDREDESGAERPLPVSHDPDPDCGREGGTTASLPPRPDDDADDPGHDGQGREDPEAAVRDGRVDPQSDEQGGDEPPGVCSHGKLSLPKHRSGESC